MCITPLRTGKDGINQVRYPHFIHAKIRHIINRPPNGLCQLFGCFTGCCTVQSYGKTVPAPINYMTAPAGVLIDKAIAVFDMRLVI